ncbi:TIGR04282 family arsenosugar biosynthesis glycosyltransferase [Roseobacter sp. EG26]|uniref:TIGR04282 family arsenosugar biosynthesis glycosyltransferase n=1 Tax=Roseobacter sp. EG26 TaxID=3412477 RepID=UPI003CE475B1
MRRTLVVMLKEPRPGCVKTRLGRDVGMVPAAWWFRHQTRALLRRLRDPRWQILLAVSPDREGLKSRVWPGYLPRVPQGRGNLGDRMARAFQLPVKGPVCIIGADIPGIHRHHIMHAFKTLGQSDAVFGPAPDGGYWLIGLKRTRPIPPDLFVNVRWSSEHALADTLGTMPDARVAYIEKLRDVDTAHDLRMTAPKARAT